MSEKKAFQRYMVTSALPYANGPIHIGHLAGAYLPADIYVRYLRMKGEDVVYVCGSDEHGVPITLRAKREHIPPQAIVDRYHAQNKKSFEVFGIDFDYYHRTSAPLHHETASDFFKVLYNKGEFLEETSEQFFDVENAQFLADRYITGTCPNCGFDRAYGDQCESCGKTLSPRELINPKSAISGNEPVLKETKHWYLPLDRYQADWLEAWIDSHEHDWKANVYGQCKSWLNDGLKPRAVTRDLDWGVPVPIKGTEGKVLYVWFDAPIGYISSTKQWALENGKDWEPYWKDESTKLVHFIGKDNIVFHCIIFPAMLRAEGSFILPDNVPSNEFLNLQGDKLSTSRNHAVWLDDYMADFPGQQDVLRYAICANMPENKDMDFTWQEFQQKNNNELVATLGNFVNRCMNLCQKFFDHKVPPLGELLKEDEAVLQELKNTPNQVGEAIEHYQFRKAVGLVMDVARMGDRYFGATEPWKIAKNDLDRAGTVIHITLQIAANLSILCRPFLPTSAGRIKQFLNVSEDWKWQEAGRTELLAIGHALGEFELLFHKIEDEVIQAQLDKLRGGNPEAEELAALKQEITFDDFVKMDIRVGTIKAAAKVPKADKLLQFTVDLGFEERTILSGIAEHFAPAECVGKQVCVLANLAPRKIRGVVSQGMILLAEDVDGRLVFVSPEDGVKNGVGVN